MGKSSMAMAFDGFIHKVKVRLVKVKVRLVKLD
jgi:hypothetical protein